MTAARAQGFVTPPASYIGSMPASGGVKLWKAIEGRMLMMFLDSGPFPGFDDLDSESCHFFLSPGVPAYCSAWRLRWVLAPANPHGTAANPSPARRTRQAPGASTFTMTRRWNKRPGAVD